MPVVDMKGMLDHAYHHRYAVGGFDLVSLDFLEAIVAGAETARAPVILSLAESHFEHFDFGLAMAATVEAARRATVPVAIHLDHGTSLDSAVRAINLGCNGVMVDASTLSFSANVAATRAVVEMAHGCGVPVEGELGYVAGVEGEDAERHPGDVVYTSVEDADRYVAETGVDFLAVSIGTVHGRLRGTPKLDFDRLARIDESLRVPLVIHGGTGLSVEQYRKLIDHGTAKINYYTALADVAAGRMRTNSMRDERAGYTGLMTGVRRAIQDEVQRMIDIFGSRGQADAVLAAAPGFDPVSHVIEFNVTGLPDREIEFMMARGRELLGAIPGVRRVVTGWAVTDQPRYRFCWLVEFAHRAVIDSYREHPDHVRFANELFRPVASDRVSIDFVHVNTERSSESVPRRTTQA